LRNATPDQKERRSVLEGVREVKEVRGVILEGEKELALRAEVKGVKG
jgi:hypothetical protein